MPCRRFELSVDSASDWRGCPKREGESGQSCPRVRRVDSQEPPPRLSAPTSWMPSSRAVQEAGTDHLEKGLSTFAAEDPRAHQSFADEGVAVLREDCGADRSITEGGIAVCREDCGAVRCVVEDGATVLFGGASVRRPVDEGGAADEFADRNSLVGRGWITGPSIGTRFRKACLRRGVFRELRDRLDDGSLPRNSATHSSSCSPPTKYVA